MKKRFYFCLFLLFAWYGALQGQIVNIPDANFKAKLIALGVDTNSDGEIQNTEAEALTWTLNVDGSNIVDLTGIESFINLTQIHCENNQLTTLDVSNLTNLEYLICKDNSLTSLDVAGLPNLMSIVCDNNLLTSLDVSNLTNLTNLDCAGNSLASLDVTSLINLTGLFCNNNQLVSLDVSNLTNLVYLYCRNNQLVSLDVSNTINLTDLFCENNQLTILDVSSCNKLYEFRCENNHLTTLDVSNCGDLQILLCVANDLNTLFVKNGVEEYWLDFYGNPNLYYICADVIQFDTIQNTLVSLGMINVELNSYCSYAPNGLHNTVSGKTIYDSDVNGCTVADSVSPFLFMDTYIDTICSNQAGNYNIYMGAGNYTITPHLANASYFSVSPIAASGNFPDDSNHVQTQDFCIVPNGVFDDVEITLVPMNIAQPGFESRYKLVFHNKGTTVASGDITLDFMGNKMAFVSANTATMTQTANQLTWSYVSLKPFESKSISFKMDIFPPPTNNVGDILGFHSYISYTNDVFINDNTSDLKQDVVNSHDPNDKTCIEGHHLLNSQIGDYLHYLIRFQNTGNYPADHVVVVDSINTNQFDLASLQILETSHSAHISIVNNSLQFYFEDIQLADSFSNEVESHGYVLYKIRTKSGLPVNSSVSNGAEIYFDYNLPVVTNVEVTSFGNTVGVGVGLDRGAFSVYPNPAQNILNIESEKAVDVIILNIMGESVISKYIQYKDNLDISALPNGVYWVRDINNGNGQSFIKQ